MAKIFKRYYVFLLIVIMCTSMLNVQAFAKETLESGNIWYGDEVTVDVTAGTEGYTYMTCFQNPRHAYEISNHAVDNAIPQTFVLVDTVAYDGETWTPDGLYVSGQSNYEVVYCCDIDTGIKDGVYYKRMNLEDSEYCSAETAARIRAIITNSYPYVSLEEMIANLAADDFPNADKLTRADIIAAVQAAVWTCANDTTVQYLKSHDFAANPRWGGVMHDYSAEMGKFADISTGKFIVDEEVGARVNDLIDYLLAQDEVYANKKQVVITDLQMVGAPVLTDKDTQTYKIKLTVTLNNSGSGYDDNINITVTAGDPEMNKMELPVVYGTEKYSFELDVKRGDEIKAVVSGTQVLPEGVYFYAPKPADVNGDGIATGREVSQNLVGVSMGETPVYFEETLSFQEMTFVPGTASNISYMMIKEDTGEIEFISKIDLDGDDSSVPIITKDGYIAAMFIKQAQSGLFWIEEEVDADIVNAVINCLKANNRSYKSHAANIAFGYGEHNLEFKKGKVVTYAFSQVAMTVEDEIESLSPKGKSKDDGKGHGKKAKN